jgi:hypothetical protein
MIPDYHCTKITTMPIEIIVSAIMALLLLGPVNGVIIRWFNVKSDVRFLNADEALGVINQLAFWNSWWHRGMLAIRCFLILIIFLESDRNYYITVPAVVFTSLEYNITINLINGLKWYYLGTTAKTDILLKKIFIFLRNRWARLFGSAK